MPWTPSNIGGGADALICSALSSASRSASTALICSRSNSSRSSSRQIWALKSWGKRTAIASLKRIQPRPPIATQRLIPGCALREEQSFDPVDVLDPFHDQHLALTANPAAVFIFSAGARTIDRPAVRRACGRAAREAKPRHRFWSWPDTAGGKSQLRLHRQLALNSFAQQDAVNPEAVQPRFLDDDKREGFAGPRARFPPELRKTRHSEPYLRRTRFFKSSPAILGSLCPTRSIGSVPMRQILREDRPRSWSVLRIDQLHLAWSPPELMLSDLILPNRRSLPPPHGISKET